MRPMSPWKRTWPYLVAAVGGFGLAWLIIAVFVFPPGAPPADGTVPNVIGLSFDVAGQRLRQAGYKVKRGEMRYQASAPKLSVLQMTPDAGSQEALGTAITLDLSAGPRMGVVPDVTGMAPAAADSVITTAGFTIAPDTVRQASDQPLGMILGTQPVVGTSAPVPSAVAYVVSAGPANYQVPDLAGRTIIEARTLLEQVGLGLGNVTILSGSGTGDSATVSVQNPEAGTMVPAGTKVAISVSGGSLP